MLPSRARTTLAAILASAVLVTAGCGVDADDALSAKGTSGGSSSGSSSKTPAPVEPGSFEGTGGIVRLKEAAEATAEIETMAMTMDMQMTGVPLMGDMTFRIEGSIDTAAERAHMTMDMTDMLSSMGGATGMPSDAGLFEMIIDGDTSYMKSSLFEMVPGVDSSKPWFEAPSSEVSDSEMFEQSSSDPRDFLEFLRNSGSDVTELGTEEVRGVETTHLSLVLDPETMIESASDDEKAELEESFDDLGAAGITEIPVEVWVDGDGLVRRMTMSMDMSGALGEGDLDDYEDYGIDTSDMAMVITIEMFDFGEPVDIEIPDPSEVQEMPAGMLDE